MECVPSAQFTVFSDCDGPSKLKKEQGIFLEIIGKEIPCYEFEQRSLEGFYDLSRIGPQIFTRWI